ncbi:putative phospholipase B-like 2 [Babylonia areolata]|uniref:putative phospholipase B-like 2 n=1 Tax=Babylonia areolata TaxID=304850 RepID=UPI003FD14C76
MKMEMRGMLRYVCVFVIGIGAVTGKPVTTMQTLSLKYNFASNKLTSGADGTGPTVVEAKFDNKINETGWGYLQLKTAQSFPDSVQAYAAGVAEGRLTRNVTMMHWTNTMAGYCPKPYSQYCSKLSVFLTQNLKWMQQQIQTDKHRKMHSPLWHHVELFLYQAAGIADALNGVEKSPHTDVDPMGFYLFQMGGDLDDLETVLGDSDLHRPLGSGSCSALVKLLPGNKDLYVSQDTWDDFQGMLRILKVYDFPWKMSADKSEIMPGRVQAFSSSPGTLMSGDDYYLLSSGLVTMETTIGNSNSSLWQLVTPSSLMEGVRSVVSNRVTKSGAEWASTFSLFNSGTSVPSPCF